MDPKAAPDREKLGWGAQAFAVLLGVVSPIAALVFELTGDVWAGSVFEPLPTGLHVLLVALVPAVVAAFAFRSADRPPGPWLHALWGAAVAVTLCYSVVFGPFAPLSIVCILALGLGLLPLAPLTALVSLLLLRPGSLRRSPADPAGARAGRIVAAGGFLVGLSALSLAEVETCLAERALVRASRGYGDEEAAALADLRRWYSTEAIFDAVPRECVGFSPLALFARVGPAGTAEERRFAAWRATGKLPPPVASRWGDDSDDWDETTFQGRRFVGFPVKGLCLASVETSGTVRVAAAVADVAWTLTFRNERDRPAEARALVELPTGAVVSDATLWVNEAPRDAVFAATAKAREVYEKIVSSQRDPLLVTHRDERTVLVQCFPVPASGTMKIRLRVAVPLLPDGDHRLVFDSPRIAAANFGVCDDSRNEGRISVDGDVMAAPGEIAGTGAESVVTWNLPARPDASPDSGITVHTRFGSGSPVVVAADPLAAGSEIVQTWVSPQARAPGRVVFVLDAGAATREQRDLLPHAVESLPDDVLVEAFAASDVTVDLTGGPLPADAGTAARIREALARLPWEGGVDAIRALRAGSAAGGGTGEGETVRVWFHGPQPLLTPGCGESDRIATVFTAFPLADGDNALVAEGAVDVRPAPGRGEPLGRWTRLLASACFHADAPVAVRTAGPGPPGAERIGADDPAARALAALWARDRAAELVREDRCDEADRLAVTHRIVTPRTAAIVLETDEDYRREGIDVPDGSVPTIPEPGAWAILAVVAAALAFRLVRRSRARVA